MSTVSLRVSVFEVGGEGLQGRGGGPSMEWQREKEEKSELRSSTKSLVE